MSKASIRRAEIEALFASLGGEISDREGSPLGVFLFGEVRVSHRPHPSPATDEGAVGSIRVGLNGGADFYGESDHDLIEAGRRSLAVYREMPLEKGIGPRRKASLPTRWRTAGRTPRRARNRSVVPRRHELPQGRPPPIDDYLMGYVAAREGKGSEIRTTEAEAVFGRYLLESMDTRAQREIEAEAGAKAEP